MFQRLDAIEATIVHYPFIHDRDVEWGNLSERHLSHDAVNT